MCFIQHKLIFLFSVFISIVISVYLSHYFNLVSPKKNKIKKFDTNYNQWLYQKRVKLAPLSADLLRYGPRENIRTESEFLFNEVRISCVIFVSNQQQLDAVHDTWTKNCNNVYILNYNSAHSKKIAGTKRNLKWVYFCNKLSKLDIKDDWILIAKDVTYVIVSNLRLFLTFYDVNKLHYFGKLKQFWNVKYNEIQAGIVINAQVLNNFRDEANQKDLCNTKFQNQNIDFILGNVFNNFGVSPEDTKDSKDLTTFHTLDLNNIIKKINNDCCSRFIITFNALESSKMYTYYYLLEVLEIFYEGSYGNKARELDKNYKELVWKTFLKEHGIKNIDNITSQQYFEAWVEALGTNYTTDFPL